MWACDPGLLCLCWVKSSSVLFWGFHVLYLAAQDLFAHIGEQQVGLALGAPVLAQETCIHLHPLAVLGLG